MLNSMSVCPERLGRLRLTFASRIRLKDCDLDFLLTDMSVASSLISQVALVVWRYFQRCNASQQRL